MFQIQAFTFNPIQENTYILFNELKECIIIDPGCYFSEEKEQLESFISNHNLQPKYLLNTHCHLDHVFGNKFVHDTFGLSLHMHALEKTLLELAPATGLIYNTPFDSYQGEIIFLDEKDIITLGNDQLEILFTPGHSPGSICFYCAQQHFVISGDVLFQRSIGRTDLPGGDYNTLINSIKNKLWPLPDDTKVYSGHGSITTIVEEKKYNPFLAY